MFQKKTLSLRLNFNQSTVLHTLLSPMLLKVVIFSYPLSMFHVREYVVI